MRDVAERFRQTFDLSLAKLARVQVADRRLCTSHSVCFEIDDADLRGDVSEHVYTSRVYSQEVGTGVFLQNGNIPSVNQASQTAPLMESKVSVEC